MKFRKAVSVISIALILIPLGLLYFVHSLILHIALSIWVVAVLVACRLYGRGQALEEKRRLLESVQRTASATLNHHRHDWMNDLQVLYGYIQLGKHDKVVDCVERIKNRMEMESRISKLGIPSLVFYLQSFREVNRTIQLDIEVQEELQLVNLLSPDAAVELTETIIETVRAYQFVGRSSWGENMQLKMSISIVNDEVTVEFQQEGNSSNVESLWQQINIAVQGKQIVAKQLHNQGNALQLCVSCGN